MLIERQTTDISSRISYTPREVTLKPFAVRRRFGEKKRKTRLLWRGTQTRNKPPNSLNDLERLSRAESILRHCHCHHCHRNCHRLHRLCCPLSLQTRNTTASRSRWSRRGVQSRPSLRRTPVSRPRHHLHYPSTIHGRPRRPRARPTWWWSLPGRL